ncbi:lipopolysaccharide kinase InaA family protein [Pseudofulvibacter geojedonensis]|uniref:Lipopolysaccharide kinase InaA family protein n=1 Tax=Pseudofulvibacter geojedonensis TaxID=1123758 RepID=A0ABW3I079_9FLAO
MNYTLHPKFKPDTDFFTDIIENYSSKGEDYGNQNRNSLKLFDFKGITINVKSFKVPNIINQIVYRFFRKSKAERSYEYANRLTNLGIGTPTPIGFYEFKSIFLFNKSYYISEHLDYELTYRELTTDFDYPNHEEILRAFTRFTFNLHEQGVNFLDHSPGNTLIRREGDEYKFYLVDLNRMEFKNLNLSERVKNFAKLTTHKSMIEVMSDEYAKCTNSDYARIFDLMWSETNKFQEKFHRRRRLKKQIKFWK